MGRRRVTRIRLDYIHEFRDRHGKVRRYFRRPGFRRVPLRGHPGSEQFMEDYAAALAGAPAPIAIGASRTKPGTVNAAVVAYYGSDLYSALAAGTKKMRRYHLERFRKEHGERRIAMLQRDHVGRMIAARSSTPAAARSLMKALRGLMEHCIAAGLRSDDPTLGVRLPKAKADGIHTWTEADIATFEAAHPVGTRARLAMALLLYSGQRRGDVVRMGRQHIRDGVLHVVQQKTGAVLALPVHPDLAAIIDKTPSDHLTFLVTHTGAPFSSAGFGNLFRDWCNEAGLPRACSSHGLRKAACRRLAEAGASANVIASISGHKSLREVERYTKAADQARMAKAGMEMSASAFAGSGSRTPSGKPE